MTDAVDLSAQNRFNARSVRAADTARQVVRGGQMAVGVVLVFIGLGIWFAPGATWAAELLLIKLAVSFVALVIGGMFLQMARRLDAPKVEIDTLQHEIRLVHGIGSDRLVVERCRFADLSRVVNSEARVQLWGHEGALLAEVSASDRPAHRDLVTALKVAGKL
ncbi:MAG: hypothetical protein AB8B58_07975 [Roseobacter sp.]